MNLVEKVANVHTEGDNTYDLLSSNDQQVFEGLGCRLPGKYKIVIEGKSTRSVNACRKVQYLFVRDIKVKQS